LETRAAEKTFNLTEGVFVKLAPFSCKYCVVKTSSKPKINFSLKHKFFWLQQCCEVKQAINPLVTCRKTFIESSLSYNGLELLGSERHRENIYPLKDVLQSPLSSKLLRRFVLANKVKTEN